MLFTERTLVIRLVSNSATKRLISNEEGFGQVSPASKLQTTKHASEDIACSRQERLVFDLEATLKEA